MSWLVGETSVENFISDLECSLVEIIQGVIYSVTLAS